VPPVLLFAIVYHIECASTYYNTKNQVLKKAETEGYKKSLAWGRVVLVGLILSGYLLILDRRKETI
jgi:hypothetical protein